MKNLTNTLLLFSGSIFLVACGPGVESTNSRSKNGSSKPLEESPSGLRLADFREYDSEVKAQGSRDTCSSFATAAVLENLAKREGQEINISEEHIWSLRTRYPNLRWTEAAVKNITDQFIAQEAIWPYGSEKASDAPENHGRLKVAANKKIVVNFDNVYAALAEGSLIVVVVDVTDSLNNPTDGKVDPSVPPIADNFGHAMAVVGAVEDDSAGGGYMILKNSWGPAWGNSGYGYLPLDFCKDKRCEGWSLSGLELK